MSTITVVDGALVSQHPSAIKVYTFDWNTENLAAAVTITTSAFVITVRRGLNTTPLVIDAVSILAGSRTTQCRLSGGTEGTTYRVTNTILDNESPTQTKPKYLDVLVQA